MTRAYTITPHQIRILQDIANGLTSDQIAVKYHVSHYTVMSHLKNIRENLRVHSKAHAIAVAMREGLIT